MPTKEPEDWDPLVDAEGTLDRPGSPDVLPVPKVIEADSSKIIFNFGAGVSLRRPPKNLLQRFVSAKTDAALIRFAKSLGPLALSTSPSGGFAMPSLRGLVKFGRTRSEEISEWRSFQKQLKLVLGLIAAVRYGGVVSVPAIHELASTGLFRLGTLEAASLQKEKPPRALAVSVSVLYTRALAMSCGLRPALAVGKNVNVTLVFQDAIATRLGGGLSLGGALTMQLMGAIVGSGFAMCSGCGEPFIPKRRQPAFGKRSYCGECGHKAALRDAKRDFLARKPKGSGGSK